METSAREPEELLTRSRRRPEGRVPPRGLGLPRVSARTFRALCIAALGAIVFVTITGATVRLTGSGLGCADWPNCGDQFLPKKGFHPVVEFSNRGVGILVGLTTLLAALAALGVPGLPRKLFWGAIALPLSVLLQGVLGGITVLTELHPLVVMGHFLLSLAAVALGAVVALWAHWHVAGEPSRECPRWLAWLAVAGTPFLAALVITGALVTAAGPHSGGEDIARFGTLERALDVHVAVTAVFGVGFAILLVALWLERARLHPELALGLGLLALFGGQMAVGEIQWSNRLPWWLVLIHVTIATTIFLGMSVLAARLVQRRRRA
jgi:cytochrome c oxidase assembly protein subunit 15